MTELDSALHQLKTGKSPGLDGVTNEMLKHLPVSGKYAVLELINRSWLEGLTPAAWRKAEIVAIPKKGKDLSDINNYRPISLLSCLSKLPERLIHTRLYFFLESSSLLNPNQSGFRKNHSTLDQLIKITQRSFDAFENCGRRCTKGNFCSMPSIAF